MVRPTLTHTAATLVIPTAITRMAQETPTATTRTVLTTREEVHMVRPRPALTHTAATLVIPTEVAITTRMAQEIPTAPTTLTVLLTTREEEATHMVLPTATTRMDRPIPPPEATRMVLLTLTTRMALPEMTLTVLPTPEAATRIALPNPMTVLPTTTTLVILTDRQTIPAL